MSAGYRGMAETQNRGATNDVVTLQSLLSLVRRRYLTVALVALAVIGAAVAVAFLLPPTYSAEALLAYEAEAENDGGYAAAPGVHGQLTGIGEILFRRDLLEQVVVEHDLLPEATLPFTKVQLEGIKSRMGIRAEGESTFSISFRGGDPERVTQVVSHLADAVVATSRDRRSGRAEDRGQFLRQQLEPLVVELEQQETEIEAYRRQWASEMRGKCLFIFYCRLSLHNS